MRIRLVVMFIIIYLFPYTVYATGHEWDKLDQISDEALQLTKMTACKKQSSYWNTLNNNSLYFVKIFIRWMSYMC